MSVKVKTAPKVVGIVFVFFAIVFGGKYAATHGLLPANIGKVIAPKHYDLPDLKDAQVANVKPVSFPSTAPAQVRQPLIRLGVWEWNAQSGVLLANGGSNTTEGSLMAKHNVNLY